MAKETPADLRAAYLDFSSAVDAAPDNPEANFFRAATLIALEQDTVDFRTQLADFGVRILEPDIYRFAYELPTDERSVLKPKEGARTDQTLAYLRKNAPLIDEVLNALSKASSEEFQLLLTAAETSVADVRVDHADVRILRCWLYLAKAALALADSGNLSAEYALFYRLAQQGSLHPAGVLGNLPDLLRHSATPQRRAEAKPYLLAANDEFQRAFDFIKDRRPAPGAIPHLFEFVDIDSAGQFAAELKAVADSFNGRVTFPSFDGNRNDLTGKPLDLSPFFAPSAKPLRDFLPRAFDRGYFRRGTWPDPTLGGVFPSATQNDLDFFALGLGMLQATRYEPYDFNIWVDRAEVANPPQSQAPKIFGEIGGMDVDRNGNVFIADCRDHVIKKIGIDGNVTVVAGVPWRDYWERDELVRRGYAGREDIDSVINFGRRANDLFEELRDVAVDRAGNVYFVDGYRIMCLTTSGRVLPLAGRDPIWLSGNWQDEVKDGIGSGANFAWPEGLACDGNGNVYVADRYCIRKITPGGVVITLVGGKGARDEDQGYADGAGSIARFEWIESIAVDNSGNVYVCDDGNSVIRKVTADGTTSTFLGDQAAAGRRHYDARGSLAGLPSPSGLAVDDTGNLFFIDGGTIRKASASGEVVTLGGSPDKGGFEMGAGEKARLGGKDDEYFRRIAVDRRGTIYAANREGTVIRGVPVSSLLTGDPFPQPTPYPQPLPGEPTGPPWPEVPRPTPTPTPTPGQILDLSLDRSAVVLAGQDSVLTVTGTYTGTLQSIWVSFSNASTPQTIGAYASAWNWSSSELDGHKSFKATFRVPRYAAAGVWRISNAQLHWGSGFYESYPGWADGQQQPLPEVFRNVSFSVDNPQADTQAPEVLAISVTPDNIDTSVYQQSPKVSVSVTKDFSGVSYVSLSFSNSSAFSTHYVWFSQSDVFSLAADRQTLEKGLALPAGAAVGDWSLQRVEVQDHAGNQIIYVRDYDQQSWYKDYPVYRPFTSDMLELVFNNDPANPIYVPAADTQAPEVVSLTWLPGTVDVTKGSAQVKARLRVRDTISGVGSVYMGAGLVGNGRGVTYASSSGLELVEGSALDGIYEATFDMSSASFPGSWGVQYFYVRDRAGNELDANRWESTLPPVLVNSTFNVSSFPEAPAPVLRSLQLVSSDGVALQVDTRGGSGELRLRLRVTNGLPRDLDYSWPPAVGVVGIRSASGTQRLWSEFGELHLVEGTLFDGTYEVAFVLPQHSEAGSWTLDGVELFDAWDGAHLFSETELAAAFPAIAVPSITVLGAQRTWSQQKYVPPSAKQIVAVSLSNLSFAYDGTEKIPTATVELPNLNSHIILTYNGTTTAPIDPGSYTVVAFLSHPIYAGRTAGTMTIAPSSPPVPSPTPTPGKPDKSLDGSYAGNFFSASADPRVFAADSGQLQLQIKKGLATGKILVDGQWTSLPKGQFREEGSSRVMEVNVVTKALRRITVKLTADFSEEAARFVATVGGDLTVRAFDVHPSVAVSAVKDWRVNSHLKSSRGMGHGFASAVADGQGEVFRLSCVLPGGTKATAALRTVADRSGASLVPAALVLGKKKGLLLAQLALNAEAPANHLDGTARWAGPSAVESMEWSGSKWMAPAKGSNALTGSAVSVPFHLAVGDDVRFDGIWSASNKPSFNDAARGLQLKVSAGTGLFGGTLPAAGANGKPFKFSGLLVGEKGGGNMGRGFGGSSGTESVEIASP